MADEFQNRKDIEKLYNLIYARTTDSPVTQKSEFDEFKDSITETLTQYVLQTDFYNRIVTLNDELEDLKKRVDDLTPAEEET